MQKRLSVDLYLQTPHVTTTPVLQLGSLAQLAVLERLSLYALRPILATVPFFATAVPMHVPPHHVLIPALPLQMLLWPTSIATCNSSSCHYSFHKRTSWTRHRVISVNCLVWSPHTKESRPPCLDNNTGVPSAGALSTSEECRNNVSLLQTR